MPGDSHEPTPADQFSDWIVEAEGLRLRTIVSGQGWDPETIKTEEPWLAQEDLWVQREIYRAVRNATRTGRVNRLILLHGPNGSAKSTTRVVKDLESFG